jgi:hypothetical protein
MRHASNNGVNTHHLAAKQIVVLTLTVGFLDVGKKCKKGWKKKVSSAELFCNYLGNEMRERDIGSLEGVRDLEYLLD